MKLNTKKTVRECECTCHLNPLNKTLGKVEYCSKCICMHTDCQPTENQTTDITTKDGKLTTEKPSHYPDCEINNNGECDCWGNYKPTEKPMEDIKIRVQLDKLGYHLSEKGYSIFIDKALAEYKQKLISLIENDIEHTDTYEDKMKWIVEGEKHILALLKDL